MNIKKPRRNCITCGKEVKELTNYYCNNSCAQTHIYNKYVERWLLGLENGMSGKTSISNYIRRYLFEKYDSSCELCHWSKINLHTNSIPLEIHHIDGDYTNNRPENLQLLCPNCHSLTGTNGSLNKGKGRPYTRVYK